MGTLKRNVQSVTIDPDDKFFYCGTTTGDILKINFETKLLVVYGPQKNRFTLGVETVREMKGEHMEYTLGVLINTKDIFSRYKSKPHAWV